MSDVKKGSKVTIRQGRGTLKGTILAINKDAGVASVKTETGREVTRKLDLIERA